ncbi:MAG: dTDP-4-dehydrorhamnose 3,5-epimerase [Tepidisphaeraceae bacterium]|jgi:dTDP-4-dehydrorhamnose 3,5-epimerase
MSESFQLEQGIIFSREINRMSMAQNNGSPEKTEIDGAVLFNPKVFGDGRGAFYEAYRASWMGEGMKVAQWNISRSASGVVRGLHYHRLQSDYWLVPVGQVRVALVDVRPKSPTHRKAICLELGAEKPRALLIPPGVLHGYAILQEAMVMYLVNVEYTGQDEYGVRWNDPALGLPKVWYDIPSPTLSNRDMTAPMLKDAVVF